jgi:steroid 5-alpha reductase family enzyme
VAGANIIFGIGRGIAGGVLSALTTSYGLTWIASLLLAIAVAVWGARLTNTATARIATSTASDLAANVAAANRLGRIELGGFFIIFTLMIAMHFGY